MTSPAGAHHVETDLDCILSLQRPTGVILAADAKDYRYAWIRDMLYKARALLVAERYDEGYAVYRAVFDILHRHQRKIDWVLYRGIRHSHECLHPRYEEDLREVVGAWPWKQNDSIGLFLFEIGRLVKAHVPICRDERDEHLLQRMVLYLDKVEYWTTDNGMWEQDPPDLHFSSIAACTDGLRQVYGLETSMGPIEIPDGLIERGDTALTSLNGNETPTRRDDMALLATIWPFGREYPDILERVETSLLGDHGTRRHEGDWYHQECDGDHRGREAEWPLGLLFLGLGYLQHGNRDKAQYYLDWSRKLQNKGGLPESYQYSLDGKATPCEHSPLLWAHGMATILERGLCDGVHSIH